MATSAAGRYEQSEMNDGREEVVQIALDSALLSEARKLDLDLKDVLNRGLQEAVVTTRRAREFQEENKEAFAERNAYVEKHGLLLDRLRSS